MEILNEETFKAKVFDFEKNKEWKFSGDKPCIVDFYADWCGPCKILSPILEEISIKYAGKLDVYKVNTDKEQNLAAMFDIQSIPTLLFVPLSGKPMISIGLMPKERIEEIITKELGVTV
ncbi:MAG: thioredoxin [Elusimicrobiota bacterium]